MSGAVAYGAQDWVALSSLSRRLIVQCKGVVTDEDIASAYASLGTAQLELGDAKSALATSEDCVKLVYLETACHINEVEALVVLGRRKAAAVMLDKVDRMVEIQQKMLLAKSEAGMSEYDRKMHSARLMTLAAVAKRSETLRQQMQP